MIKFCCDALARAYDVIIFGVVPRLEISHTETRDYGETEFTHTEKIYYCPFCGEKLQNLGKTIEEFKAEVKK